MSKINLDENLKSMEEISEKLESETISIEESMKLFEMGITIYRTSIEEINRIKNRLTILIDGEEQLFAEEGDDD
jgi:exodeoxyribonuclease VII small subunit